MQIRIISRSSPMGKWQSTQLCASIYPIPHDWVNEIVKSSSPADFSKRVSPGENASMWQGLSFGANYKSACCMAVCPAGEDVIGQFLESRQEFLSDVVKPLQEKKEIVYVVPGSDAEQNLAKRFPHKTVKRVRSGLTADSIEGFLYGLPILFQPSRSRALEATYQFKFTGRETKEVTVTIKNQRVRVSNELLGKADLSVTADSDSWLKFLLNRSYLPWALLAGQIKLDGPPRLLLKLGQCFPN